MSRRWPVVFVFVIVGLAPSLPGQSGAGTPTGAQLIVQAAPVSPAAAGLQLGQSAPRIAGPSGDTLIVRPTDNGVPEGFRRVYRDDNAPRFVICVNRAFVDAVDGAEKKRTETEDAAPGLADKLTVTEIERMFGRAFRNAGARLSEQKVATSLTAAERGARLVGDAAAKDRKALAEVADIAIEVLIIRRHLTVAEPAGNITYPVPDIQATAIRLSDATVVGRASAGELLRKGVEAGRVIRNFDLRDISAATAVALMEDMLAAKP